ncbi:MAG TPA: uracil-DNA glycosylase [Anaerolineae bacterium]|nr:uracil-DNA glycosylase [Anaerolineae bacterium]
MSELTELAKEIAVCERCILSQSRRNTVPGEGPEDADIMFIGEAPGFHEDRQGRPFVGAAGQFLNELLESIGLKREDVYITNVIKCRPPANRDPLVSEIEACWPYLERQIELIQPKMIVTLGRYSMERFFPGQKISRIHGRPRKMEGIIYYPIYHPAAALHQPRYRADVEADFQKIPQLLAEIEEMEETEPPPNAEQLSLF